MVVVITPAGVGIGLTQATVGVSIIALTVRGPAEALFLRSSEALAASEWTPGALTVTSAYQFDRSELSASATGTPSMVSFTSITFPLEEPASPPTRNGT